jgi:hypothetical protein
VVEGGLVCVGGAWLILSLGGGVWYLRAATALSRLACRCFRMPRERKGLVALTLVAIHFLALPAALTPLAGMLVVFAVAGTPVGLALWVFPGNMWLPFVGLAVGIGAAIRLTRPFARLWYRHKYPYAYGTDAASVVKENRNVSDLRSEVYEDWKDLWVHCLGGG